MALVANPPLRLHTGRSWSRHSHGLAAVNLYGYADPDKWPDQKYATHRSATVSNGESALSAREASRRSQFLHCIDGRASTFVANRRHNAEHGVHEIAQS
jgi:hypothetical protein